MPKLKQARVLVCNSLGCSKIKGPGDPLLIVRIDQFGRLVITKFRDDRIFGAEISRPAARSICSFECMVRHASRWMHGQITAADQPEGVAPACWSGDELTCWVSDVYKTSLHCGEARVINYRDDGQKRSIWCFKRDQFSAIDRCAGFYATFSTEQKGEYTNVTKVLRHFNTPPRGAWATS